MVDISSENLPEMLFFVLNISMTIIKVIFYIFSKKTQIISIFYGCHNIMKIAKKQKAL